MARWSALVTLLVAGLAAGSARAQASSEDAAAAQVLWEEGRELAKAGNFEAACPKFAESQRLDPQLGTLLNLGDCYARIGKAASAWASFVEAAALAKQRGDPREEEAVRRSKELEPKLAKLRLKVEKPPEGLVIERDGVKVSEAQWGSELPIDPGEHKVVASAPGHTTWEGSVTVEEEGAVVELAIPPLEAAPDGGADGGPGVVEAYDGTPLIIAGSVVSGLGVVGLVTGVAFAVIAKGKDNDSLDFCDPADPTLCQPEGVALRDEAREAQTISIVSFVGGGLVTLIGVGLLVSGVLLDGQDSEVAVLPALSLSPEGGGLTLRGRF